MSGRTTVKTGAGGATVPSQNSGAASLILTLWFALTAVAFWGRTSFPRRS